MKSKYNCPVCGKVPMVAFSYLANSISCCSISVTDTSETKRCISKWKKMCKLFKKEYEFDRSEYTHERDTPETPAPTSRDGNPPRKP